MHYYVVSNPHGFCAELMKKYQVVLMRDIHEDLTLKLLSA